MPGSMLGNGMVQELLTWPCFSLMVSLSCTISVLVPFTSWSFSACLPKCQMLDFESFKLLCRASTWATRSPSFPSPMTATFEPAGMA